MLSNAQLMKNACKANTVIPAFNIPYLPMMEPVVKAIVSQDSFAFVAVARPEWTKFEAKSPAAVYEEYIRWVDRKHVSLHLDHVPVVDEENQRVDYESIIRDAIKVGYPSVMVDGSRLNLAENIAATRAAVEIAHQAGVAIEAELGAVMGHEAGPLPPYEEIFASGKGFTDPEECTRYVQETGCDWLSVAIGNIHGAISGVAKDAKKVEARLNIERLATLKKAAGDIPLVLHGGSGVRREYMLEAIKHGICKINVGAEIRQTYEKAFRSSNNVKEAQDAVFERTCWLLKDYFNIAGNCRMVNP